jgi:hypothetical protein
MKRLLILVFGLVSLPAVSSPVKWNSLSDGCFYLTYQHPSFLAPTTAFGFSCPVLTSGKFQILGNAEFDFSTATRPYGTVGITLQWNMR